jgi:hypothetical protein
MDMRAPIDVVSDVLPHHFTVFQLIVLTILCILVSLWASNITDK